MLPLICRQELAQFAQDAHVLRGIVRGIERETLRVDRNGQLARTPHPLALGAKLTHPAITTDYAEAMLEFITAPSADPQAPLIELSRLHRFAVQQIKGELLWATSMPCRIGADTDIDIAQYGRSNAARFKEVYRLGLGLRYGRAMQTIAGAHYNWSLPDAAWARLHGCCGAEASSLRTFKDRRYLGLMRNFLRWGWLLAYLFGASPALCRSFMQGRASDLQALGKGTLIGPYATSLRMSDLGYQNRAQDALHVGFDDLASYCAALEMAIRTPDPYYAALGVREGAHWHQLNANLLQSESEYYAPIRPKQIGQGERPARALLRHGVQYLEVRMFDLDPFAPLGFSPEQAWFTDALLLMCLFHESPPISAREQGENDENRARVVGRGRQPGLRLLIGNHERPLADLAHELLDAMQPFAQLLDAAWGTQHYAQTMQHMAQRVHQPETTPSARVLQAVQQAGSYFDFAFAQSSQITQALQNQPLGADELAGEIARVAQSHTALAALEAQPQTDFADYVTAYYAQ